ncbi:hypothetical protein [Mycobacterium uberis]|uniref:hypothetical protein n=1 Tax=Mycobacterium uberis TaxID=2162698 RepID=UPI001FB23995|nr:hypothetical protein [Mycobacterium uberis]
MSAKVSNDQFLPYAFDGQLVRLDGVINDIRRHRACPDLTIRLDGGSALTYPRRVLATAEPAQLVEHELADHTWCGCLAAVVDLAGKQLVSS